MLSASFSSLCSSILVGRGPLFSGATSLAYLMMGLLVGILAGSLNDRFGPRIVMSVTGVLCRNRLLRALSGQLNLATLSVLWSGRGCRPGSADVIPLTVTARWFVRRRGMMTGIIKVGTGSGQLIMPLLAGAFIIGYGWRYAFICFGIVVMVILVGAGQMLRRDPGGRGNLLDGPRSRPGPKLLCRRADSL